MYIRILCISNLQDCPTNHDDFFTFLFFNTLQVSFGKKCIVKALHKQGEKGKDTVCSIRARKNVEILELFSAEGQYYLRRKLSLFNFSSCLSTVCISLPRLFQVDATLFPFSPYLLIYLIYVNIKGKPGKAKLYKMLRRREQYDDTYLTYVCRDHCSRESTVKR